MNGFFFDLQRFADWTGNATNGFTYTDSNNSVITVTGVSGVSGDPTTGATLTLGDTQSISNVRVTITNASGTTNLSPGGFRFLHNSNLYTPNTVGETQSLVETLAQGYSTTLQTAGTHSFRVAGSTTTDGTTTYSCNDYKITLASSSAATVSATEDGTVTLQVTSGTASNFIYQNVTSRPSVILLSGAGTFQSFWNGQPIILGSESGPTVKISGSHSLINSYIKLNNNTIDVSSNYTSGVTITLGKFSYAPTMKDKDPTGITKLKSMTLSGTKVILNIYSNNTPTTFTYDGNSTYTVTSSSTSHPVTVTEDNEGNIYFSGAYEGTSFTVTKSGITYTYTRGKSTWTATYTDSDGSHTKIGQISTYYNGEIPADEWDVDSSTWLSRAHIITDGKLTIDGTLINELGSDSSISILQVDTSGTYDYIDYGKFKKNDDNTYTLEGVDNSSATAKFNAITVSGDYSLQFSKEVSGVPITVSGTTFASMDTLNSFSYSTLSGGALSVSSASVSLISGTLQTSLAAQSVAGGNHSVSGYGGGTDGLTFARASSTAPLVVGDIDTGEYFNVNGTDNYTLLSSGLLEESVSTYKLYTGVSNSITLGNLGDGAYITTPTSKVLEIGDNINQTNFVVFDSQTNPSVGYASIYTASGNHTLTTLANANFSAGVSTISLTGGSTTIYKDLIAADTTIATGYATFYVTSNDTFTVDATSTQPKIDGATSITLLNGTITATAGQTIKLGNNTLAISSGDMLVNFNGTTATVQGSVGDTFSINNVNYVVNADTGEVMTFNLGTTDKVTVSGLDVDDIFTYDGTQYSLKGAGFIKGNFSLLRSTASSVQADSLTSSTWLNLTTVTADNSVTISGNDTLTTFIKDDFSQTFGSLAKQGNVYYISTVESDKASLSNISLTSDIQDLSLSGGFVDVTIQAPNSTFKVTDDGGDGYSFNSTANSLSGVNAVSLISGNLTADSNFDVSLYDKTIRAGQSLSINTGTNFNSATIGDISLNEQFSISGAGNYTLSGAGFFLGDKILRGSKGVDSILLASLETSNSEWRPIVGLTNNTLAVDTTTATELSLVVDDKSAPTSLFGELVPVTGGYSLNANNGDPWLYPVSVDDTALTLTSDFANATLNGAKSAATFTLASLNADTFSIADGAGGASLAGIAAINQTAGFVVQSDGLKSIVVGNQTINNSNDLPINVSVNGSDATLSAIDINDTFNVNSTEYSRNNLGIFTAEQFLKDSAADASSATLADLNNADKWIYTASVSADGLFNVPPTPSDKGEWLVVNHDRSVRYGTISTISGGFSIAKSNYDSVWGDNTFQISNGAMLSLSSDFAGAAFSLAASNAQFSVAANAPAYTVTDAQNALVSAPLLFQSAGSIAVTNQSIVAANHSISGNQFTLSVQNDNATVGALAAGDSFTLDDKSYTLLTNGRLQSSDDLLWNAATIKTDDTGSVAVDSVLSSANWNGIITTTTDGTLTLNSKALGVLDSLGAAYIVNDATIYGTINKDGYYLTNADNTGSSLSSIIFTASMPNVSLSGDFINVPLHAATNQFKATKADDGFRVNFDGSTLNLDGNAIVDLSSGNLILDESDQTITGGNHSVGSASESVNVSYDGATLTVDDFATAGESLALNSHNYSIVGGDGITLKASDASTIIDGITTGDRFKIDAETFIYTDAGFGKTEANSDKLAYLLKAVNPTDNAMTLADLQSTDENLWLGIYLAESGNVTISNDIPTSVVFVDDLEQPAINYGQAVRDSNGSFAVGKYTGSEAALSSVSDVRNPESILVESGITATIEAAYSQIPVKTNDATSLTFYDSDETAHTLSGTVDKFVPSTMTFTPVKDDSFALDGADYWQAGAGLTRDDSYIWTTAGVSDYVLPGSTWSNLVKLSAGGELTLTDASDGDNVVVDNASSERYATLTKSGSSYDVNSTDGKTIDSIVLEDGDATVTTDFATTISTGEGTYNINGNSYTGDALTIDATASSSTLYKGTVSIEGSAVTATNDNSIEVSSGTLTATAEAGKWTTLGELTAGDTFTIAGTKYQVQGTDTLVKLSSSGGIGALYVGKISGGTLSYDAITGDNYSAIIGLNSDNNLDLTSDVGLSSAIVVGQVNGEIDATNRIAKLSYADNSYTLSDAENLDDLNAVLLKDVKEYNSSLATTVKTSGTGTFTINGKEFAAQSDLTVVTEDSGARLTAGEVTLATGASVDTRYGSVDETISATSGSVNVSVANGAVTISDMSAGDVFSVNGTNYAMTAVGLVDVDNQLNCKAQSSITTADLSGADWKAIIAAPDGDLVLNGAVAGYVADIDLDNPADAKKYGTLTVENGAYTLTQDNDTVLESVDISGVKVTLPAESAKAIKTAGATFAITAQEPYTLDATGDTLKLENVASVELTDGEITVAQEVPINADGKTITPTNGTLTVGVDDNGAYVGALNSGDEFTVDDKAYRMTAAGLLNVTDGTLDANITETYYPDGTNDFRAIIAVESDGVTLNLTNQTTAAEVYDSADNPSVHMATFSSDKLTKQAGGIEIINLGENRTLEVDFAATVNASGTTTVNGNTFAGTGDLVIDATADDSTLQSGTITLDSTNPKAQATADDNALEWVSGTFTATAEGGHFTKLSGLNVGEEFKFGKTYRQSAAGLISGSTISEELAGETVDLTKLNSATWSNFIAPTDGTLDITNSESALVFDNVESPTKKLAELTVDDKTTLNGTESATEIKTVEANASDITVDFATRLKVPSGTVTVNGNSYTGTTELQIDSDGTTSTLYEGTVTLNNAAIKATNETSELAAQNGTITAQVASGKYVTLSDIQNGDTFKLDKPYTRTAVGMMTDGAVIEEINSDTIDVSELTSAEPVAMIAPVDGELDLTNPAKSVVVDNVDSPTIKYANLDVDDGAMTLSGGDIDAVKIAAGADLTVDFATEVNSPIGTVTVNNQNYTGTTALQIESDGTTSTLTSGTVELAAGDSVKTTSGNNVSVQAGGLTVTADDAVTLGGLTAGDEFTADGKSYKVAAAGLLNVGDVAIWTGDDISDGLNVDALTVADNWQTMAAAPDGMLEINAQSGAAVIVDDVTNPTKIYGTLTDDYKLSAEMADSALSGINVAGVVAEIDAELAIIPLTINSTTALTVTPSGDSFEVDGTGTAKVDGVDAIEVSAGELELRDGQSVTVAADDVTITAGTGTYTIGAETFKVTNLSDGKTLTYSFESGEVNEVSGFEKGTTVEIDSTNYVSPRDEAILHYNDEDGWYFDAAYYDEFTVTVDSAGKVTVVPGMRFKDVVASGEELDSDRTVKLAATVPVKVISDGAQDFSIADADGVTLAQNFSDDNVATFSSTGIDADDLTAVSGAEMTLANGQKLTAGDTTITATADDTKVGINSSSNGLSLNKGAEIIAPAEISLTLNAGKYAVNGEEFGASGSAIGTTTADGVKLDIAKSDALTYNGMQLSDAGTATIESSSITVSGGAIVTNTTNKVLTVDGTAYLDEKTINAAEATEVTARALGIDVGDRSLTVTGDEDGYTINLADNDIAGLEEIGGSNGVTVDGGGNATVQTDMAGAVTAEDETYTHSNSEVNYGLRSDKISSISGAGTIVGDFNSARTVNGDALQITGADEVTVISSSNGVKKVEVEEAGAFTVNEKSYEIQDDESFAFNMSGGEVSGVASVENGTLIIGQDENKFDINNERLTFSDNGKVTLGIADSRVASVHGADGTISGLRNATVYDVDNATINGKSIKLSDAANVIVSGGTAEQIVGLSDGATVRSAPNMTVSATNGTYTFVTDEYTLADTLDGAYEFLTDSNSRVRGVDNYAGTISGPFDNFEINGKTFNTTDEATIGTDGENITSVDGIENGGAIDGDLGDTSVVIPEGDVTINGVEFNLTGDTDGASLSGNGTIISGLEKDATLAIGKAGTYEIDGKTFEVNAGDSFTTNRDGVYMIDPNNPPISEKTNADDIIARGENPVYVTESGSVDMTGDKDLALIEGTTATVTAGDGDDSVVVRHGAEVDINLDDEGSTLIIPTAGRVTLENYNGDNAQVQTFDYSNLIDAVKGNSIQFGNGGLDLGDAVIIYDEAAESNGSTAATLINAHGERQAIAFTHMKGGTIDLSDADENYLIKGNYAENEDDTLKGGGSAMTGGAGNDTILAGSRDTVDGGEGNNQIYLTDKALRSSGYDGATLILSGGKDTVHNFASGFNHNDDKISINNINDLEFGYAAGQLVLSGNGSQMTFDNVLGNDETTYELRLSDGTRDTNAAIAKENATIQVLDGNTADVFYGNEQGISFSEYTGAVEVNLNENGGTLDGRGVNFYNIDKVAAGAGDTSLIGAANKSNTLFGGTGNSSIWSNSGKDLMVGNSDENKLGSTRFFYMTGDGLDTITNFDFMSGVDDITQDVIQLDDYSGVTDVILRGSDVMIGINNSTDDYLTLADAKGKSFRLNDDLIAKVDTNVEYDGFTNCYVGYGDISTLTVGRDMGDVAIWLSDDSLDYHGIMYDGIRVLDASTATGNTTLAGSESDNLIIGGAGANSIWGGYAQSNDTLVGGSGQNTFFFAQENGHDVIQGAHDGDVVSLEDIYFDDITRADITSGGVFIELNDGATLEIQSTANLDYRLQDGTTYTADRTNRQWNLK